MRPNKILVAVAFVALYLLGLVSFRPDARAQYTPPGGGRPAWGSISGTLSDQTDLQSALNAKATASIASPYLTVNGTVLGPIFPMTVPPLTGWTADNSAVLDTANGFPYITMAQTSAVSLRGIYRTAAAAPYTDTYFIDADVSGQVAAGSEIGLAIGWRQSSTGKITTMMPIWGSGQPQVAQDNWTDSTHFSAQVSVITGLSIVAAVNRTRYFVRCQDDNTNLTWSVSVDGIHFAQIFQVARGSFMTGGPDQIFLGAYPNSGRQVLAVYSLLETTP